MQEGNTITMMDKGRRMHLVYDVQRKEYSEWCVI